MEKKRLFTVAEVEAAWQRLHADLRVLLARYGEDDAFGEKEYWLHGVPEWGSTELYLFRVELLESQLVAEIRALLAAAHPRLQVRIVIDLHPSAPRDARIEIIVGATGIEAPADIERKLAVHYAGRAKWIWSGLHGPDPSWWQPRVEGPVLPPEDDPIWARWDAETTAIEEAMREVVLRHLPRYGAWTRPDGGIEDGFSVSPEGHDPGDLVQEAFVTTIDALPEALALDLQTLLREQFAEWRFRIVLCIMDDPRFIPKLGIEIHADRIVHHWDRKRLKAHYGDRFKWTVE